MGVQVPERAEYIRVIMAEFTRIVSHFIADRVPLQRPGRLLHPGSVRHARARADPGPVRGGVRLAHDVQLHALRRRGVRPAGRAGWIGRTSWWTTGCRGSSTVRELLTGNEIFLMRSKGVGDLTGEQAIALSMAGPMLRASGVPYDLRRAEPYSIYDRFDFDVITLPEGDVWARFMVRMDEMRQSIKHPAAGAEAAARRADPARQEAIPGARPGGRGVFTHRRAEGRARLLRRQRRQAEPVPLSRPGSDFHQSDQPGTRCPSAVRLAT